jgi:hypothetical protein
MTSNYKCTFGLEGDKNTSVTQKQVSSQRAQYGGTVQLFIGTGHSPYKITFMPFTLGSNSIVIHRGLNSLFIFKSVSFSATTPKLSRSHLRRCINLRIALGFSYCDIDSSPKIHVHTLYSRNTVKSCFWGPSEAEGPQQVASQRSLSELGFGRVEGAPVAEEALGRGVNSPGTIVPARGWARARRDRVPWADEALTWIAPISLCSLRWWWLPSEFRSVGGTPNYGTRQKRDVPWLGV